MSSSEKKRPSGEDIAIIGMAARLPGARDIDAFWVNLRDGVESIRQLTDEELLSAGVNRATLDDPAYVKACPVLDDIDKFDAGFFGFSARDALVMDPAHRLFLEVAWHAFEHAGYAATPEEGPIGVFAGSGAPLYFMENLRTNPQLMRSMGEFLVRHTGNDMNFLATRVSYEMDLRGPSINVQTACSSSLVSVHMACQSLARGECVMALAGGSTILVPQITGYHFREGEILSSDGHCRPFDAKSTGAVFGSGVGAVVLKRLQDALDDGDTIHAVIKGSAINNDGAIKVSYLAPGVQGQAEVIGAALEAADVTAESVSYIETHGTGTLVGDPIEVEALNEAFRARTKQRGYCAIGSVKSNIGHLGEAAGVASLIKAVMALKHRQLPPSLGYEAPNPAIDFANSPFFVNDKLRPWTGQGPLRCGVTALGAGGTNCHVILEEAPRPLAGEGERAQNLILLSASTKTALDQAAENLASALETGASLELADAAYTLTFGRRAMAHRRVLTASTLQEAIRRLRDRDGKAAANNVAEEQNPKVVFMFPGGGAQYASMGRGLYEQEEVYRDAIDACLEVINPALGRDLRALMFPETSDLEAATRTLERPSLTLPSLFATEYALAQLYKSWGVTPNAVIGHSLGEYVAACVAGVLSLEDAIKLVMMRGRLFEIAQRGGMLSVPLSEQDLRAFMPKELDIAAVNGPELSVASGAQELIARLRAILSEQGVDSTPVHIDVAAHSSLLDPILGEFRDLCRTIKFRRPQIPFVSNLTGTWITAEQATSPEYWVSHLRSTVRFADGLSTLRGLGDVTLLELGPGRTLSMLARAQATPFRNAVNSIRHPQELGGDLEFALMGLGRLWAAGVDVDWSAFYDGQLRNRIPLPGYPFEGQSFWAEPGKSVHAAAVADAGRQSDIADWFFSLGYAEAPLVMAAQPKSGRIWLVLAEDAAAARRLAQKLGTERIIIATPGKTFGERLDGTWRCDWRDGEHLAGMMRQMEEFVGVPDHVVVLLDSAQKERDSAERHFFAPVALLQSLGGFSSKMRVSIVTSGVTGVEGHRIDPIHALALDPVLVGPREFDQIETCCIDLASAAVSETDQARLYDRLAAELRAEAKDSIVGLTASGRWVRKASRLPLPANEDGDEHRSAWVRDQGVYVITGGLGGIGLEVAEFLARTRPVKLALLTREAPPSEDKWDEIVKQRPNGVLARRISRVKALRALGAQVLVVAARVENRTDVAAALTQIRQTFGPINGVIHGAGVMDDAPMMTKSAEAMKRVLAPKVDGALALDAEIKEDLDFFLLFSSVASFLGLPGQVDYTAANCFQDAFARARAQRAKGRTVVVNWNAWRDVGMAASALKTQTIGVEPSHRSVHPAFDGYTDSGDKRSFVAAFEGRAEWLLSEHVVKGGAAVLPGTAFVELARAAFAEGRAADAIELSDLTFAAPFRAEADRPHRLTVEVEPLADHWAITMRADGEAIVTGQAHAYRGPRSAVLDLAEIKRRCARHVFAPADGRLDQDFMAFGPRWANIREASYGASEALVELALPDAYHSDLQDYVWHPALLDMATGGAQALLPGVDLKSDFFVPLGYERIRVFAPMSARVFSHVRCLPDSGDGLAYFDITLADADGRVIGEISRFTMRRITPGSVFGGSAQRTPPVRNEALAAALRDGIAAREGVEALDRIMTQPQIVQIVASSVDINAWNEQLRAVRVEAAEETASGEGMQRPAGAPDYVAPSTGAELALAKIWGELLGYQPVGVQDNFFDLGGNSLIGVRLFAAIRKRFSASLPLATLFEAQTIADLAKLVSAPEQEVVASGDGWSPLVCLKPGTPGRTPLFLIHGSRGNVLVFKAFADRIQDQRPIYALQAAGVDGRMQPDQTIEEMAERYLAVIRKVQPQGPYMFAGYSGGGVIGYEMARRLRAAGQETKLLMMIDTLEPSQMRANVTMFDRVRNAHRIKLRRFMELPGVLWKYQIRPRIRRLMKVQELAALRTPLEAASDAVDAAYKHAQWAYQTENLEIDVVLIRATDARMHFLRSGPTLGWGRFVKGEIKRFDVDCEHDFAFDEPALSRLLTVYETVTHDIEAPVVVKLAAPAAQRVSA